MNLISRFLVELQDITLLFWRMLRGLRKQPRYFDEMVR
ncbi:MAG: transporter, partial [Acidobacteria bacterium]